MNWNYLIGTRLFNTKSNGKIASNNPILYSKTSDNTTNNRSNNRSVEKGSYYRNQGYKPDRGETAEGDSYYNRGNYSKKYDFNQRVYLNKYRNIIGLVSTVTFIAYFVFCIWEHFYPSLSFAEELFLTQQKYNYREFSIGKSQSYTIGSKESILLDTSSKVWNEIERSGTPGFLDEYRKLRIKYKTFPGTYEDELRFLKVSFGYKDISYRLDVFDGLKSSELANIKAECSKNEMEFLESEKAIVRKGYSEELKNLETYFSNKDTKLIFIIDGIEYDLSNKNIFTEISFLLRLHYSMEELNRINARVFSQGFNNFDNFS